jgi:hypothetical protein
MHLEDASNVARSDADKRGPRSWRWLVGGLAIAVMVLGVWRLRSSAPLASANEDGREGVGLTAGADDVESRETLARSRSRPFQRSENHAAQVSRPPWQARLHTNGTLDAERLGQDAAYTRKVMQSDRLKTLMRSPARDTPEFGQIVAFADRKGLPLAATVDLYNILWATRDYEQRVADAVVPAEKEAKNLVRELELADFQRRFQQDFSVDVAPMLEELFALPIQPTVFLGVPHRSFAAGETLLSD